MAERMYRVVLKTPPPEPGENFANRAYRDAVQRCSEPRNTNGARVIVRYLAREYGLEAEAVPA